MNEYLTRVAAPEPLPRGNQVRPACTQGRYCARKRCAMRERWCSTDKARAWLLHC